MATTYKPAAYGPTTYVVATDSPSADPTYRARVDPVAALEALPEPYGRALTLDAAGLEPAAIAERLDLPFDALSALLEVGRLKLATLLAADEPDPPARPSELGV